MRVLITGGYGCIGSWVIRLLLDQGHEPWVFDLREDRHRLDLLLEPHEWPRVHFLPGDVVDPDQIRAAAESAQATHLLHLAGLQVPICRADPIRGARVNVIGSLAVFETARILKDQIERVVFASSAAVHGPQPPGQEHPISDEALLRPVTHYGAFKVANELNARVYYLDQRITSIGLRPWTVYGVGRDFGVTSEPTRAIKAAAAHRPYHISYGGLQDLQYVRDVAGIFLLALSAPYEGADSFNIRGDVVSIEQFVATLESVAPHARGTITHGDRQLPIAPSLDDSRLRQTLGPIPATPLESGVRETFERFRALHRQGRLDLADLEA